MSNKIDGSWKITEMSNWDQDFVDLVVPGYFAFDDVGSGNFQFGCVEGNIHYDSNEENSGRLDFSWYGNDEFDEASGRGWVEFKNDDEIYGKIYIYDGDESEFFAERDDD